MKFITKPNTTTEEIVMWRGVKSPSFLDLFRTDQEKIDRRYRNARKETFAGRATTEPFIIEDTTNTLVVGEKVEELSINEYTLYGVLPIEHYEGETKYTCVVDHYTIKEG